MAKKKTPKVLTISDQLRRHIEESGLTAYRIAIDSDLRPEVVTRFMNGQRSLSMESIDKICRYMDLELVRRGSTKAGTKKRTRGK